MRLPLRRVAVLFLAACSSGLLAPGASAQTIGTFRWQLHPYCNIVTLHVVQQGGVYALDGIDDQCGGGQRASVSGTAFLNPDGSIGIGVTTVLAPGGVPVHVDARITLGTLSGPWRDSAGNSGTFVFTPGPGAPGPARPAAPNGVAPASITLAQMAPATLAAIPPPSQFSFGADGSLQVQDQDPSTINLQLPRLRWLPGLDAFRAGLFDASANIGRGSWAGGFATEASGLGSFAFGLASSARAVGAIAMGGSAHACGEGSVALGVSATTSSLLSCAGNAFANSFVFGDGSTDTTVLGNRQFVVRASGGMSFWSSTGTSGCHLNAGAGAWSCASDRALKERFEPLDGEEVLRKVAGIAVETWSFKTEPGVRHAGPVAQDFRAAFGLGADDTTIGYTDINGINMRAIQALELRTRAQAAEIDHLELEITELRREIAALARAHQAAGRSQSSRQK